MRTDDAAAEDGAALTRAEAVARCCRQLISTQQQQGQGTRQSYSLVLFNKEADIRFTKVNVDTAARLLQRPARPTLGTNFSAAWLAVEELVAQTARGVAVHVVFLSDGRPGELDHRLPPLGQEKETARCDRKEMDSAPAVVRRLATTRSAKLTVYAVAIGEEEPDWLQRLVHIAEAGGATASFMSPETMNLQQSKPSREAVASAPAPAPGSAPAPAPDPVMAPPPSGPPASSSMMPPPPMRPPPATSSLADAFSHISSSLTSSMAVAGAKQRVERTDEYEDVDAWRHTEEHALWKGHKLIVQDDGHSWVPLESQVRLRRKPFAHGGQRNAFHLFYDESNGEPLPEGATCALTGRLMLDPIIGVDGETYDRAAAEQAGIGLRGPNLAARTLCRGLRESRSRPTDHFVAKESRYKDDWNARLSSHKLSMRTALEAQTLVAQFNECTPSNWPVISVLPAEIYRLAPANIKAPNPSRDYRYLSVEPYLEGRYKKFNGNNGFVGVSTQTEHAYRQDGIAQTFPHWTYEHTLTTGGSAMMVCDIQGVGYEYTDVTVCSKDRRFGQTDLGEAGFESFFSTHRCNELCVKLGLTPINPIGSSSTAGPSRSTATSAIEIIRTNHLRQRKRQREIETREMQAAVKHGRKEPGNVPGSVKHTHRGVAVVTDAEHRVGITTYPKGR